MMKNICNNGMFTTIPPVLEVAVEEIPTAPEFEVMTDFEIGLLHDELFGEVESVLFEDLIFI